ncbi:MAG: phage tail assembly chaperone [Rhodobacteraceae bacterium]|nr:phage tail assembly chaperone [Paracoccaceae bacterium]
MSGLDWAGLMRVGIRGLGLAPAAFWRLSPAELALMLGEAAGAPPLTRARLDALVAQWPDEAKGTGDDRG